MSSSGLYGDHFTIPMGTTTAEKKKRAVIMGTSTAGTTRRLLPWRPLQQDQQEGHRVLLCTYVMRLDRGPYDVALKRLHIS